MKTIKKIAKVLGIYALITGYFSYLTDQIVIITDPKNGVGSGKIEYGFPWKHILDNCKKIFNNVTM